MLPVEILPVQETIVLRARGSELLILPHHVKKLQDMTKPRDFSQYFRAEALVNRPARKLFEAWLRKDHTLWPRLYQTVHKEMDAATGDDTEKAPKKEKAAPAVKAKAEADDTPKAKAKVKAEEKPAKPAKEAKAAPKAEKKEEKKADKEPKKAAAKEKAPAKEKEAKAKPKAKAAAGGKKKG